jgi:hypothetical protein
LSERVIKILRVFGLNRAIGMPVHHGICRALEGGSKSEDELGLEHVEVTKRPDPIVRAGSGLLFDQFGT